ncbi:MAG: molybdenum cofactor guanylyltransferase [Acidobacteriota bacterium]
MLEILRILSQFLFVNSEKLSVVILAGGQSRRMGFNKALIEVKGQPLIRILSDRVRSLTSNILISSNDPDIYDFLDIPVVADRFVGHGPLAGLHAAMLYRNSSLYVLLACDLPNLPVSMIRRMIVLAEGYDAAIPRTENGLAHPLCAVYRRTCLPHIEEALKRGEKKFIEIFFNSNISCKWIGPEEGQYEETDLININTPEDLHLLES